MESSNNKIFSVSEFIERLNRGLGKIIVKIEGEVSEFSMGPTGHIYFSLKDGSGLVKCVIWKSKYNIYGIKLEDGMKIIISGHPEIYPVRGRLTFMVDSVELVGEGELKKEYEKLKTKLTAAGLFEESKKRPIPKYTQKIGIITSRQGAVIADFLNNLDRFGFQIKLIDARVEGQEAVPSILSAIRSFKKIDIDVLVITRGGGPLESMLPFNNEMIVREVAKFPVPVIVAIGHDKDIPLAALSADLAVSTSSIAATTLSSSWNQAALLLEKNERRILNLYDNMIEYNNDLINKITNLVLAEGEKIANKYNNIEKNLLIALQNYRNKIQNAKIDLDNSLKYLFKQFAYTTKSINNKMNTILTYSFSNFELALESINKQLNNSEKLINRDNPERQLRLGYSIATSNGKVIRSIKAINIGSDINIRVSDGNIDSEIKHINK
ncbi:MAG: exodeoxyribonuclease VII large subunit [Patescibacteria group bacterium]|nr:exodeoxyribonuclease VII large subunit [Patescibacteria group bacterium]